MGEKINEEKITQISKEDILNMEKRSIEVDKVGFEALLELEELKNAIRGFRKVWFEYIVDLEEIRKKIPFLVNRK